MRHEKRFNIWFLLVFLSVIVSFACVYNSYVTRVVADAAHNYKEILHNYNAELIDKLVAQNSEDDWYEVIRQYDEIAIKIENGKNEIVAEIINKDWSMLDVEVRTPFQFNDQAYLLRTSAYFLKDYISNISGVLEFVLIEFTIGLSALWLLMFIIYEALLKPFRGLYKAIEEYDKTGKLKKVNLKGYAGHVYNRFSSLTENLEKQQDNQRRIIASISHDIKTPLTSIMGYAERLSKDNISEERRTRYLDTVYGKSLEIQHLVNEFDEYLSFDVPQQFRFEKTTADLIAADIVADYEAEMELQGVDFRVKNLASKADVCIDKIKIKRVFDNIFNNCIKHFKDEKKIIDVEISSDRQTIYIEVSDNGEGVEEEKLDVIFEPLYTSDKGRKVAGLGLAICREIIDGHGGKIYAKKSRYGGLSVCIELDRKANYD